jgi:uncharacterized protein DUF928
MMLARRAVRPLVVAALLAAPAAVPAAAQQQESAPPAPPAASDTPAYKPPLRGAPGGRVGGASRGATTRPSVTLEPVAPEEHTGLTTSAAPTVYYFVSRPVNEPVRLTLGMPNQPRPLIEATLPTPQTAGLQPVRLAEYQVQLQPGQVYAWSVTIGFGGRGQGATATASIMRTAPDPAVEAALRTAPPQRRASVLAQAGLWYDAVAAAAESAAADRHAALDALLDQVRLTEAAAVDRRAAQGGH